MCSLIQFERKGNVFCRCQQEKQEKVLSLLTKEETSPTMMEEVYKLYREVFPYIFREEETLREIIGHDSNIRIEKRNDCQELIAVSLIRKNAILLLVVREDYRRQGIGSSLLRESEEIIRQRGYDKVVLGVGDDYLMPGVPTSKRYFPAEHENLYHFLNTEASDFFERRGYKHSWHDSNCFDMRMALADFPLESPHVGDTIKGCSYRWANANDLEGIIICVQEAEEDFVAYYRNPDLYVPDGQERVLVAIVNQEIAGTLIVGLETEGKGQGCVGCTTVKPAFRGRHIGVNMVMIGTRSLKDAGLDTATLSYTYSGLDHMYGYSGYQICTYYMMGEKLL